MLPCVHGLVWLLSRCSDSCPGVPGAIVHAYTKKEVQDRLKAPVAGEVTSEQFSGLVNKWMDSSPKAGASVKLQRDSEEGGG